MGPLKFDLLGFLVVPVLCMCHRHVQHAHLHSLSLDAHRTRTGAGAGRPYTDPNLRAFRVLTGTLPLRKYLANVSGVFVSVCFCVCVSVCVCV